MNSDHVSDAVPPLHDGSTPVGDGGLARDEVLEGYQDPRSDGKRDRDELRASALLVAAGGLVVIASFFPLLVYATDGFVWRIGIWVTFNFAGSGEPGTQIQWVSGIAFTLAALLALWAAFDVVRSRGQADGWPRRQQLFSAAAGLLVGTCGLQAAFLLPTVFADQRDLGGDLLVTPGAGLYLIAASALVAIAALVLNWLAAPRRLQLVARSASAGAADGPVPSSPEANPGGTPAG